MLIDAWLARAADDLRLTQLELADGQPDEVLVQIAAVGICHTDVLHLDGSRDSPFPLVAGHEGAGVVAAVGSAVHDVVVGDHVVISYSSCGSCRACRLGRPAYCTSFRALNSGFGGRPDGSTQLRTPEGRTVTAGFFGQSSLATYALTRSRNLTVIPASVPLHLAAPLACGVQTGAGAVLNTLDMHAGDTLLVLGAGAVGMSAVLAAVVAGASTIVVVDRLASRRELAITLGAAHALDAHEASGEALRAICLGGFDLALDTTGRPELIRTALAGTHTTGTVALVAAGAAGTEVSLPLRELIVGRRIRGLVEGDSVPQVFIPVLLELWRAGRFPLEALVTPFAWTELPAAIKAMHAGHVLKPVLLVGDQDSW